MYVVGCRYKLDAHSDEFQAVHTVDTVGERMPQTTKATMSRRTQRNLKFSSYLSAWQLWARLCWCRFLGNKNPLGLRGNMTSA